MCGHREYMGDIHTFLYPVSAIRDLTDVNIREIYIHMLIDGDAIDVYRPAYFRELIRQIHKAPVCKTGLTGTVRLYRQAK